eukprot:352331-Chlamydomonas_euryale.AAC.1
MDSLLAGRKEVGAGPLNVGTCSDSHFDCPEPPLAQFTVAHLVPPRPMSTSETVPLHVKVQSAACRCVKWGKGGGETRTGDK